MYRHVYNKGVTGGTEGDILGKLPRKRANPVNIPAVVYLHYALLPRILPLKTGRGMGRNPSLFKPDTRRGWGSSKSWQLVVKPDP